jgi:hypothetical protein
MRYLVLLMTSAALCAHTGTQDKKKEQAPGNPWLTGPLLTPSANTIPKGHFNIETYVYVLNDEGKYNTRGIQATNRINPRATNVPFVIQMGLADRIDLTIIPQFTYSYGHGRQDVSMGDLIIGTSYQLLRHSEKHYGLTWNAGLKQLFPSGRFENLNPIYAGNDCCGSGSWSTTLFTAVAKQYHIQRQNFLSARSAFQAIFYMPTEIHGTNAFGGDSSTTGRFDRGFSCIWDIGLEFTISRHWAIALDIENQYMTKAKFTGVTAHTVGNPKESYMLSFAPAIEYNFNENWGFIAGVWVSAFGTNDQGFVNGLFALNWYK